MSPRTVADKILIPPGSAVWCVPGDRLALVGDLPDGVDRAPSPAGADIALVFADDEAALRELLSEHGDALHGPAVVWIAYPKGGASDLKRDTIPPILGELGMRPIGQVAVDDAWSALRFRPLRPGEPSFRGTRR